MACTLWRPLASLDPRRPWRFAVAAAGGACILLSGFRGSLVRYGTNFLVGSALRRKWLEVFVTANSAVGLLALLIAGGYTRSLRSARNGHLVLPINVDRSKGGAAASSGCVSRYGAGPWNRSITLEQAAGDAST
jgi:hypothetical protein